MTIRSFEDARGETTLDADVVIVGTGPGGSAIARVLALAGRRVVLLEEGPPASRFQRSMPHTMRYHMQEGGAMVAFGQAAVSVAAKRKKPLQRGFFYDLFWPLALVQTASPAIKSEVTGGGCR